MSENTIVLTERAASIVKTDARSFKRETARYADYVIEMEVTPETVAAHVAVFRTEYKALFPNADGDEIKAYATKVRNGLNRWAGKKVNQPSKSDKYVTARGLKESDRDAFLTKCAAEWDAANSETATLTAVA